MVVTPSRTEDAELSRFQKGGGQHLLPLSPVPSATVPLSCDSVLCPTHTYMRTIRGLPKWWPRPLSLTATCILFVSPKDSKPPGQCLAPVKVSERR